MDDMNNYANKPVKQVNLHALKQLAVPDIPSEKKMYMLV